MLGLPERAAGGRAARAAAVRPRLPLAVLRAVDGLRGRLPAVVLGATAGWMAGQASVMRNRRYIEELVIHSQQLELLLEQTAP